MVLCAAALIVNLDNTILNVALPTRSSGSFTPPPAICSGSWTPTRWYSQLLLVGRILADRFGRKALFLFGLTVFAAGSIGAALSGSVNVLIGWRGVMGAGAALADSGVVVDRQ